MHYALDRHEYKQISDTPCVQFPRGWRILALRDMYGGVVGVGLVDADDVIVRMMRDDSMEGCIFKLMSILSLFENHPPGCLACCFAQVREMFVDVPVHRANHTCGFVPKKG